MIYIKCLVFSIILFFRFIAGVIKRERFPAFEKVLWRLFHENFLLRRAEIEQHPEVRNENKCTTVCYTLLVLFQLCFIVRHLRHVYCVNICLF